MVRIQESRSRLKASMQNMKNMPKIQITTRKPNTNMIPKQKVNQILKLNSILKPSLKKLKLIQKPRNMKKLSASLENRRRSRKNPENTKSLKNQRSLKNMKSRKNQAKSRKKNPKIKNQKRSPKMKNYRPSTDSWKIFLQINLTVVL